VQSPRAAAEHLETERLLLQSPDPADIDLIYSVHSNPRACLHNPSDMLSTRAEAEDLYVRWDEHWQLHGVGYWVIRLDHEGIGFCGLKVMTLKDRSALNLFYRLLPSTWGSGLATEAATAVVEWADAHRADDLLTARIRPANSASQRVALRAGLHRTEHLDAQGEDGLDWIYSRRRVPEPP